MPFKEIYFVDFAKGNLKPDLNMLGWPDMELQQPPDNPNLTSEWTFDLEGRTGRATRGPNSTLDTPPAFNRIYVVPPTNSVSINSRLMTRVTFDRPLAEGFDDKGDLHPIPPQDPEGPGVFDPDHAIEPLSIPELWTVVVSFGLDENFQEPGKGVHVTCQFNRRGSTGVRLNTPFVLQQGDQADQLESPLNYSRYTQSGLGFTPPLFALSHSFCGVSANVVTSGVPVNNTPGVGTLEIMRKSPPSVSDHRVYSSRALVRPSPNAVKSIGALGVTIMIEQPGPKGNRNSGIGCVSARLRTFSVLKNEPLAEDPFVD